MPLTLTRPELLRSANFIAGQWTNATATPAAPAPRLAVTDPATGAYGATLERQCELMFDHVRRIVEAGGGTLDHIAKMTVWMRDRSQRKALNAVWLQAFPDADNRPARHTMQADLDGDKLIECDFVAVIGAVNA